MLPAQSDGSEVPPLPARGKKKWNPLTVAYWQAIWESPMAAEYLKADVGGLYILIELVDRFWKKPTTALAAEIRLQRQCYGLTPIDRRRLEWEVERVEQAARKQQPAPVPVDPGDDPRRLLTVVV